MKHELSKLSNVTAVRYCHVLLMSEQLKKSNEFA